MLKLEQRIKDNSATIGIVGLGYVWLPLEALGHYQLIHRAQGSIRHPNIGRIAEVKIFDYVK